MDKNKNPHVVEEEEKNAVAEEALTSPGKQSPSSLPPSPAPPNPPSSFDFPAPTNPNSSPFPTPQSPSIGKLRNPQSTRSDFNSGDLDRSNHGDDVVTDDVDLAQPKKKPRTVWSLKLHTKFVEAVNQLGEEYAVPSNILKRMNEKGLTRQAVASHLQKYRKYLRSQKANSGESSTTDPQLANIPFSFGPPPPSPPPLMSQNVVQPQQQNVDLRQTVGDVSTLPPDFLGLAPPNVDEKNEEGGNEEGGRS